LPASPRLHSQSAHDTPPGTPKPLMLSAMPPPGEQQAQDGLAVLTPTRRENSKWNRMC
jgi:hypothetical protein